MASGHRSLVFFLLSICFASSSPASARKVSLALYYETLCPYCSKFMVNHLPKIFDDGLISIVDLNLVPYGNARVGSNGSISCQHGPYECLLNTVEACAIAAWPDVLELQYAAETDALRPPHKYVPWVVVDGQPLYDDYENFEAYICRAYDGELPKACQGLHLTNTQGMEVNRAGRVCYVSEMIRSSGTRKKHEMKNY